EMRYTVSISRHPGGSTRSIELPERLSIGREASNDLVLESDQVSRRHARLVIADGRCVLEDLGSRNGTSRNGERLSGPTPLEPGDRVVIGDFHLSLLSASRPSTGL